MCRIEYCIDIVDEPTLVWVYAWNGWNQGSVAVRELPGVPSEVRVVRCVSHHDHDRMADGYLAVCANRLSLVIVVTSTVRWYKI
jgi:hypothetical protein